MTVEELERLLAELPADMLVMVCEKSAYSPVHVSVVETFPRGSVNKVTDHARCETGRCRLDPIVERVKHPPYVVLAGALNFQEHPASRAAGPPPVRKRGKFYWLKRPRSEPSRKTAR